MPLPFPLIVPLLAFGGAHAAALIIFLILQN